MLYVSYIEHYNSQKDQGQEDHISILIHVNEDILQTHYVMPAPE